MTDAVHGPEISWQGLEPGSPDWSDECRTLAFLLNGAALGDEEDDDFFVMLNASRNTEARFTVPAPTRERGWVRIIDTGRPAPADFVDPQQADAVECGASVTVRSMGCVVLQSLVKEAKR